MKPTMPGAEDGHSYTDALPALPELAFGAKSIVEAINGRIERHFARLDGGEHEDPLVVGLFGEWGSGKTLWLRHIERHFKEKIEFDLKRLKADEKEGKEKEKKEEKRDPNIPSITVPIFFNAWRYEREEHLIHPLIKVLELNLRALKREVEPREGAAGENVLGPIVKAIARAWRSAKRAVVAAGMGFAGITSGITIRGEIEVPKSGTWKAISGLFVDGRLSIELSGKDIVDFLTAAREGRAEPEAKGVAPDDAQTTQRDDDLLSFAERVRSDYYDFQRILRGLTGRGGGVSESEEKEAKVNLLFLIDDLDRCLPEKAVEMLEAIKLFLEVEGTAFVLALDDEVVERGIVHRYRDYMAQQHPTAWDSIAYSVSREGYREFLDLYTNPMDQPVTGHEYLEKIVHLQVRLPRVEADDVEAYLTKHYPRLFTRMLKVRADRDRERVGLEADWDEEKAELDEEKIEPRKQLVELFRDAVPPVPRKLIRAAELLDLKVSTAAKNGWNVLDSEEELYVLAQLTLIQLFAPELYRFAQREFPQFLEKMVEWLDKSLGGALPPSNFCLEELERRYRELLTEARRAGLSKKRVSGKGGEARDTEAGGSDLCPQKPVAHLAPWLVESKELPLLDHLIRARKKRSGFDPFGVVLKTPENAYSQVRFGDFFRLRKRVVAAEEWTERAGGERVGRAHAAHAELAPRDVEMFINQITSLDKVYWRNALEDEGLAGKHGRLRDDVFRLIVGNLPDFGRDATKMLDWLETLEPVLGPDQLDELVRRLEMFGVLGVGGNGGEQG